MIHATITRLKRGTVIRQRTRAFKNTAHLSTYFIDLCARFEQRGFFVEAGACSDTKWGPYWMCHSQGDNWYGILPHTEHHSPQPERGK